MHQGVPDPATLVGRENSQRAQPNRRTATEGGAAADDVSHHFLVDYGDHRKSRDEVAIVAQGVNELGLGHITLAGPSEGRGVDSKDGRMVVGQLPSKDHRHSLASGPSVGQTATRRSGSATGSGGQR